MPSVVEEKPKSPRVRLFVALDLPDELREGIAGWGREALADPALRPVVPESLHVTLAFLGHRDEAEIFALPVLSPGAEALQAGVEQGLVEGGFHESEKRPFWPHITVARVRPEGRGSKRPAVVSEPPGKLPEGLSEARICRRMTLYRSELKPTGARYVPLAQVELPG